jgi:hypothetical protein
MFFPGWPDTVPPTNDPDAVTECPPSQAVVSDVGARDITLVEQLLLRRVDLEQKERPV